MEVLCWLRETTVSLLDVWCPSMAGVFKKRTQPSIGAACVQLRKDSRLLFTHCSPTTRPTRLSATESMTASTFGKLRMDTRIRYTLCSWTRKPASAQLPNTALISYSIRSSRSSATRLSPLPQPWMCTMRHHTHKSIRVISAFPSVLPSQPRQHSAPASGLTESGNQINYLAFAHGKLQTIRHIFFSFFSRTDEVTSPFDISHKLPSETLDM